MIPEIKLSNGGYYNFETGDVTEVTIDVIAHALSGICRFTGHTRRFYSVAEHSVRASYIGPDDEALDRLMHDAAEALVGDVSTPLKRMLPEYAAIEERAETALAAKFGYRYPYPPSVRHADLVMLATEKRDLLTGSDSWQMLDGIEPLAGNLMNTWSVDEKDWRKEFVSRFQELVA